VLNIYAHRHPERFYQLPCHYNRRTDSKCAAMLPGRSSHSSTFRLNGTHFMWATLGGVTVSESLRYPKTAQGELKSGRV